MRFLLTNKNGLNLLNFYFVFRGPKPIHIKSWAKQEKHLFIKNMLKLFNYNLFNINMSKKKKQLGILIQINLNLK